ncbi:hypothetical protein NMY22_g11831 [Coprinellus aureogranulatus]|nr:hypothetical protein NMY22_g11831 [Coprinellus aureogranulatus]
MRPTWFHAAFFLPSSTSCSSISPIVLIPRTAGVPPTTEPIGCALDNAGIEFGVHYPILPTTMNAYFASLLCSTDSDASLTTTHCGNHPNSYLVGGREPKIRLQGGVGRPIEHESIDVFPLARILESFACLEDTHLL